MRDCDEQFTKPTESGIHEVTWGIVIVGENGTDTVLTWTQDGWGQPNRISYPDLDQINKIESMVLQDVSMIVPWCDFVGAKIDHFRVHTYQSNCAEIPSSDTWHAVAWAVELKLGEKPILLGSAWHGHALVDPICNDEVVVAYTPTAIAALQNVREGYREHWTESSKQTG